MRVSSSSIPSASHRRGPRPVGQRRNRLAHRGLGPATQLGGELGQIRETGVVEELLQPFPADPLRRHLGVRGRR